MSDINPEFPATSPADATALDPGDLQKAPGECPAAEAKRAAAGYCRCGQGCLGLGNVPGRAQTVGWPARQHGDLLVLACAIRRADRARARRHPRLPRRMGQRAHHPAQPAGATTGRSRRPVRRHPPARLPDHLRQMRRRPGHLHAAPPGRETCGARRASLRPRPCEHPGHHRDHAGCRGRRQNPAADRRHDQTQRRGPHRNQAVTSSCPPRPRITRSRTIQTTTRGELPC